MNRNSEAWSTYKLGGTNDPEAASYSKIPPYEIFLSLR